VSMNAEEPGDWIRVLTEVPEPTDTTAPVVYCAPGSNPGGKPPKEDAKNENKFIVLFGEDDSGEAVELFLTDTVSGEEFGPFESDTNLSISVAKGADPLLRETNNQLDYSLRVQGETLLSATDAAGNSTAVTCSS